MEPTLQAKHITKTFPGVKALTDVSVDFYPGEVHALLPGQLLSQASVTITLAVCFILHYPPNPKTPERYFL